MDKNCTALAWSDGDTLEDPTCATHTAEYAQSETNSNSPTGVSHLKQRLDTREKLSLFIPNATTDQNVQSEDATDVGISRTRFWRTSSSPLHNVPKSADAPPRLVKKHGRGKHQNLFRMKSMSRIPTPGVTSLKVPPKFDDHKATPKLHNGLVETAVIVGMSEDTGLKIKGPRESTSIFGNFYEPQILAVMTNEQVIFPHSVHPTEQLTVNTSSPTTCTPNKDGTVFFDKGITSKSSKRMSMKAFTISSLPEYEMIANLPALCFPSDASVLREEPQEKFKFLFLVLTSIKGTRSYATCLTFYRQFYTDKVSQSDSHHLIHKSRYPSDILCWVPVSVCFLSIQPYFSTLKLCLSSLIPSLEVNPDDIFELTKRLMLYSCWVPTPPSGTVRLSFSLPNFNEIVVCPPDHPSKQPVDIPLHLPFLCLSVDQILGVVAAILTQQSIVFLSNDYALLTPVMEAFLTYILPFKWPFVYVPVLCSSLLDFLEAPSCFLMGCHSSHKSRILQVEGLVVVDIEVSQVTKSASIEVPSLPQAAVDAFKGSITSAKSKYYDLVTMGLPDEVSIEGERGRRQQHQRLFEREILDCFLELLARTFRDLQDYYSFEQKRLKKEEFLASRVVSERAFYAEMFRLDIFKPFLEDRLCKKNDYYAQVEKRIRPVLQSSLTLPADQGRLRRSSISCMQGSHKRQSQVEHTTTFQLPDFQDFMDGHTYFQTCIKRLDNEIEKSGMPSVRASYLYLRGMLHIACSKTVEGLNDFHRLFSTDMSILPVELIAELLGKLSEDEVKQLQGRELHKHPTIQKLIGKQPKLRPIPISVEDLIPESNATFTLPEFITLIQLHEIAIDVAVIERLFKALTAGQTVLDAVTFLHFLNAWKEADEEVKLVPLSFYEDHLDNTESVLKLSGLIKSAHGTGRLVMTDKRVFFLTEGSNQYCEVIRINNIKNIEKSDYLSVLGTVPSLRIVSHVVGVPLFEANLKSERNSWFTLLKELWSGKMIAMAQKDPQIVQQAARNVLLLDAVIRSAENIDSMHSKQLESAALQLCHFTKLKDEGMDMVHLDTSSELVHKFNPSSNEPQCSTVEAMVYTPGNRSQSSDEDTPKLWCAMGEGRIKVFDGSNFGLEEEITVSQDRICCLLYVSSEQVWAGSFNARINVIDTQRFQVKILLVDHKDIVSDMILSEDKSVAFTASMNGQIITWNIETLVKVREFCLEMKKKTLNVIRHHDKKLWCCTKYNVQVITEHGDLLQLFSHPTAEHLTSAFLFQTILIIEGQLWCGCNREGQMVCWSTSTFELLEVIDIKNCNGISKLEAVHGRVWACSKKGKIHLFDAKTRRQKKVLDGHEDAIRSICLAENRYVMTGAGSSDGKVAIWRAKFVMT